MNDTQPKPTRPRPTNQPHTIPLNKLDNEIHHSTQCSKVDMEEFQLVLLGLGFHECDPLPDGFECSKVSDQRLGGVGHFPNGMASGRGEWMDGKQECCVMRETMLRSSVIRTTFSNIKKCRQLSLSLAPLYNTLAEWKTETSWMNFCTVTRRMQPLPPERPPPNERVMGTMQVGSSGGWVDAVECICARKRRRGSQRWWKRGRIRR